MLQIAQDTMRLAKDGLLASTRRQRGSRCSDCWTNFESPLHELMHLRACAPRAHRYMMEAVLAIEPLQLPVYIIMEILSRYIILKNFFFLHVKYIPFIFPFVPLNPYCLFLD